MEKITFEPKIIDMDSHIRKTYYSRTGKLCSEEKLPISYSYILENIYPFDFSDCYLEFQNICDLEKFFSYNIFDRDYDLFLREEFPDFCEYDINVKGKNVYLKNFLTYCKGPVDISFSFIENISKPFNFYYKCNNNIQKNILPKGFNLINKPCEKDFDNINKIKNTLYKKYTQEELINIDELNEST